MKSDLGSSKQATTQEARRWTRAFVGIAAVIAANASIAACSQGIDDEPIRGIVLGQGGAGGDSGSAGSGGTAGGGGSTENTTTGSVCTEGSKKECSIYLGENNGVISCFKGVQVCKNGAWGTCGDGTMTLLPKNEHPSEKPIGQADGLVNCTNNPCDPTCQQFDELPDGGLTPNSQTPVFSWQTGDLGDYPPGLANKGLKEPCASGSDCQFNQYCSAPVSGTCEHSKCAVGTAMTTGCDPCVNEICAIDGSCCKNTYGGTCAHDYCNLGVPLANGCNTCVNSICAADPTCCAHSWGSCAHDYCETGTSLNANCDSCVTTVCDKDPRCCADTTPGTCAHDYCSTGAALDKNCHSCTTNICNTDPLCCARPIGTCAHDFCATGTSLAPGCDPCVTNVCNQDPKCCNLPTIGSCSHDYCATGTPLQTGCDSCVSQICAADPKCCDTTIGTTTCAHDYCSTGTKLATTCDPCVAAVCAAQPSCCTGNGNAWTTACVNLVATKCQVNDRCPSPKWQQSCVDKVGTVCGDTCTAGWGSTCTAKAAACSGDNCATHTWSQSCVNKVASVCGNTCTSSWGSTCQAKAETLCGNECHRDWDQGCVDKVGTVCGKSCGPFEWDSNCVDMVDTVCAAKCYEDPGCAHDKCDSGGPLSANCDTCVASICQELPFCCTTGWTDLCVDRVKTKCNIGCPTKGDCIPWIPGQTDPDCAGYDLAVGIPCGTTVPVCNHGKTTVPAGVKVVHFPANSQQYPLCNPDQTHPQMQSCFTTAPIPPGKCINLPAASCGLGNGNREIMVNPPSNAGYTQLPECTCKDNWSLWSGPGVSCEPPSCSNTSTTTVRRVNMFLAIDRSGSMDTDLGNGDTRWTATIKALKRFVQDPASANLAVALRFWPDNSPVSGCNDSSCSTNACKAPLVPVGLLTLQSAPADTQEQLLLNALNSKSASGTTPMSAALAGATQWAIEYKAAHPQEEAIVVFATDGEPNGCNENTNTISNYAGNAFTTSGIKTYAIGIQDANPTLMNLIASKGGTNTGFFIAPGANVEYELLAALIQAKGNTVACDFVVPDGGVYDPSAAKITITNTAGMSTLLNNVGSLAQCGTGWYYDNPAAPTQIKLCPTTCTSVLNDSGTKVGVDLGCPGNYEPVTFTYQYYSDCPQGAKTQWSHFAYETLTPGNSNVVWKARTADTIAGLGSASYTTLATARSTPTNTQVCLMSGPTPCPIDLYQSFGPLDARKSYLELSVTLNPSLDKSGAAKVINWDLTYSCPPSE